MSPTGLEPEHFVPIVVNVTAGHTKLYLRQYTTLCAVWKDYFFFKSTVIVSVH